MATTASRSIVFTPANLLDGEWEAAGLRSEEEVARALHEGLLHLRCRAAEVELELGRGLKRFLREGDASYRMLSHPNAEDACSMRFGFSAAHARDLMDLAAGVERVPELGEAFVSARIGRSKLRLVMDVATSETAEAWVRWSRHQGARKLGADVRAFREGQLSAEGLAARVAEVEPEEPELVRVRWRGTAKERMLWEYARREVFPALVGHRLPASECAELLAANVLSGVPDYPEEPSGGACADEACHRKHRRRGVKLTEEKLRALKPERRRREPPPPLELPDTSLPRGAAALHDVLRILAGLREQIHAERAQLLWLLDSGSRWRILGAASREAYALEVLGLSPKEVHASLELVTKLTALPKLTRAWRQSEINAFVLRLIARVAHPKTQVQWLRFADRAALSRIEEEVAYHEALFACASREEYLLRTGGGIPQVESPRSKLLLHVEKMLAPREPGKKRKPCAAVPTSEPDDALLVALQREDPTGRFRARGFGFDAPPAVAAMVATMIEVKRRKLGEAATEGACVVDALREMIKDLVPPRRLLRRQLGRNLKVLERDGWRCANPMCRARSRLHVHHIVFRSHGGSDEPWNLITICLSCHALVHSGRLRIVGCAPDQLEFSTPIGEVWREGLREAA